MSITIINKPGEIVYSNDAPIEIRPKPTRNSKPKGTCAHPIFLELKKETNDAFWMTKLDCWSNGKYGRKFRYKNNSLIYNSNNAKRTIYDERLSQDDPQEGLATFKAFIKKYEKIMSNDDCAINDKIAKNYYNTDEFNKKKDSWQAVMPNLSHRVTLFQKYVMRMTNEMGLNGKQAIQLMDCLKLKILCGDSNGAIFNYSNDEILSVEGIEFLGEGQEGVFICRPKKNKVRRGADGESECLSRASISSSLVSMTDHNSSVTAWNDLKRIREEKYRTNKSTREPVLRMDVLAKHQNSLNKLALKENLGPAKVILGEFDI